MTFKPDTISSHYDAVWGGLFRLSGHNNLIIFTHL